MKIATTDLPLCVGGYKDAFSTGRMFIDTSLLWLGLSTVKYISPPDGGVGVYTPLFNGQPVNVDDPEYPGSDIVASRVMHQTYGLYCGIGGDTVDMELPLRNWFGFQNQSLTQIGGPMFYVGMSFFVASNAWTLCTPTANANCAGPVSIFELFPPDLLLTVPDNDNTVLIINVGPLLGTNTLKNHTIVLDAWNYIVMAWVVNATGGVGGTVQTWNVQPNTATGSWLLNPKVTLVNNFTGVLLGPSEANDTIQYSAWDIVFGSYGGQNNASAPHPVSRTVNIGQVNVGSQFLHALPQVALKTVVDVELFRFSALTLASTPGALSNALPLSVAFWPDSSGNGRGYTARPSSTSTTLPTYSATCLGGVLPGVSFSTGSGLAGPSVWPVGFSYTLMAVVSAVSGTSFARTILGQDRSNTDSFGVFNMTGAYIRSNTPHPMGQQFSITANTPTLLTFNYNYADLVYSLYLNGVFAGNTTVVFQAVADNTAQLGCSKNGFCWLAPGCVSEVVLYNLLLTPSQQASEEQALRVRWTPVLG